MSANTHTPFLQLESGPLWPRGGVVMSDSAASYRREPRRLVDHQRGIMEFLYGEWLTKPLWMWLGFFGIVITLLALDHAYNCGQATKHTQKRQAPVLAR